MNANWLFLARKKSVEGVWMLHTMHLSGEGPSHNFPSLIYQIRHYKSVKGAKLNITYAKYNVLVADEVEYNAENILI